MEEPRQKLTRQIFNRLRYIEGQAQGIRRMLLGGRAGADVLVQLRAIESAAAGARELYLRHQIEEEVYGELRERLAAHLPHCSRNADIVDLLDGILSANPPPAKRTRRPRKPKPTEEPAP